jgi:hypothetical protein
MYLLSRPGSSRRARRPHLGVCWGTNFLIVPEPEVQIAPASLEALRAQFESDLRHRRLFVSGSFALADRERCVLVIAHPEGGSFSVQAEAVYIKPDEPGAGVGLELVGLDSGKLAELEAFVNARSENHEPEPRGAENRAAPEQGPLNLYERIRRLTLRERETVARQGLLSERVALERTYGGSVWESLLQNPQLSVPEVAHIAKNGTLSVPLAAVIVANGAWLASGEVRRALLSNPRVSGAHLERVLKATPRVELKQIAQASPYRSQVRAAAKKLVGG